MNGDGVRNTGGRPRDPSRDQLILSTTFELLMATGYQGLRVDDIAERAGVSLSTMYRRWPTKGELVAAALGWYSDQQVGDDPTTIRGWLERIAALLSDHPAFLPGIVNAMRSEPELADALRTKLRQPDEEALRHLIREQLERPASDAEVRLIADIGPSVMFTRALIQNEPPSTELLDELEALLMRLIHPPS